MDNTQQDGSDEIHDEITTVQAIYGDDFTMTQSHSFSIHLRAAIELMVTFGVRKYPKVTPSVSFQSMNSDHALKSKDRDALQQSIMNHIAESDFGSDGYLFEFVENAMEWIVDFTSNIESEQKSNDKSDETELGTYVLQYDHMRNEMKYISILEKWCDELQLSGRLVFFKNIICHILQGPSDSLQIFIKRSRTQKVDVDSKGKKCKEKMMKILFHSQDNSIAQLHTDWAVSRVNTTDQFIASACDNEIVASFLREVCGIK